MLNNNITEITAYLLGLITGRGHIFFYSKIIAVEFSHTNEFAYGIIHCGKCGDLVTKQAGGNEYICKNCFVSRLMKCLSKSWNVRRKPIGGGDLGTYTMERRIQGCYRGKNTRERPTGRRVIIIKLNRFSGKAT